MDGAKRLLAEAQEIESRIKLGVENISGPIRISAPVDLGRNRIATLLNDFIERHPEIKIDLVLGDGYVDLVSQGIDLALRHGDLADSTLRAISLGKNRRIVCASPQYLKTFGSPKHPDDLAHHNCILMRFGDRVDNVWKFLIDGRIQRRHVQGNRIVNDGDLVRKWCRSGFGIALKFGWDLQGDLRSGALVEILKPFAPPPINLQLVYPAGPTQPRRVKALITELKTRF